MDGLELSPSPEVDAHPEQNILTSRPGITGGPCLANLPTILTIPGL